jgi:predicted phage gp36 major capsid-like protein
LSGQEGNPSVLEELRNLEQLVAELRHRIEELEHLQKQPKAERAGKTPKGERAQKLPKTERAAAKQARAAQKASDAAPGGSDESNEST